MIIQNKELKTTGKKTKKRFINFGLKEPFEDGTVTVIHQEQFNQLKEEYHELKENVENSIDNDEIIKLENQIKELQEENLNLKEELKNIQSENESLIDKVAAKSDIVEEVKQSNNERILDLKEQINKKEEEVTSYKSKVTDLEEENKKLVEIKQSELDSLKEENQIQINLLQKDNEEEERKLTSEITSLKVTLGIVLSKYENVIDEYNLLKNRSFFSRLLNTNKKEIAIDEISEYKELLESKKTYKPKLIETELE